LGIDGFAGVTAIDSSAAGPTVNAVLPVIPPELALIWEVPCAAPLARPAALIVATLVFDEVRVAELVRFWVLPSEYVPVAVNCWVVPLGIDGFAGVTPIDTNTAGPTVKVVLPVTPPDVALIWEVPSAAPMARPPALIVATALLEDTQVAELVTSSIDPSE
jgi:hypothetical protein